MKRVVFLGHSAQPSGAELGLLRLTRALTRYEPVVVLAENGPLVEQLRSNGVRCEVVQLPAAVVDVRHAQIRPGRQMLSAARQVVSYSRSLHRVLRSLEPDIIDTFTLKAHVFGHVAQRGLATPRVAHVHDRLATDYMRRSSIALLRVILGRCAGLVFNSTSTESTVPALRRRQVRTVVGSAIDAPASRIASDQAGAGVFTFGCLGRLTPWKGQRLALHAFADLCARFPQRDLRMRFVGGAFFDEADYVADLHSLTSTLGLTDRIAWVGHVSDVYAEISRFDALVHCSTIAEPFGQVIVEAMAYGLPVIASGEGGPADLVSDGINGLLFTPRDTGALTEAMARALTMPDKARFALSRAGLHTAEAFFAPVVAEKVESCYDAVLANRT